MPHVHPFNRNSNKKKLIHALFHHTHRSDIAERLHNVIETQWQKTLEILTTNDTPKDSNNRIVNDFEKCDKNNCSS